MARGIEALIDKLDDNPQPSWGRKMTMYRMRAGLSMRDAAAYVDRFQSVSSQTFYRLEKREDAPTDARQRRIATLALILYGVRPDGMGLSEAELPDGISPAVLTRAYADIKKRRGAGPNSRWTQQSLTSPLSSSAA